MRISIIIFTLIGNLPYQAHSMWVPEAEQPPHSTYQGTGQHPSIEDSKFSSTVCSRLPFTKNRLKKKKKEWSISEDCMLVGRAGESKRLKGRMDWVWIALDVPRRSPEACRSRWQDLKDPEGLGSRLPLWLQVELGRSEESALPPIPAATPVAQGGSLELPRSLPEVTLDDTVETKAQPSAGPSTQVTYRYRQTWLPHEDAILVKRMGLSIEVLERISWPFIVSGIPGRDDKACKDRKHELKLA
ncbi:MAG: hypothetical protein LBI20_01675 [Holosporales bacterium]|jgi:hypothetical protein|nr:hypothetical protein [Holosporales bacterium]